MSNNVTSIRIGLGLGNLRFGASLDEVRSYLGFADDLEEEMIGLNPSITWRYSLVGVNAYFSGDDHFRLGTLRIDSKDAELNGLKLIGHSEHEVRAILARQDLGESEEEHLVLSDCPALTRLAFTGKNIEFWFKFKKLNSILWGYLIDENDQVCWPD